MKMFQAITPLLWRVIAFLCLFVLISGISGPRIISSDIFFRDGFGIYGSVGKALIFGVIALVLLARRKPEAPLVPWRPVQLVWLAGAVVAFVASWLAVDALMAGYRTPDNLILAHGGLLVAVAAAALCCVGWHNVKTLIVAYRRDIITAFVVAALFLGFLHVVYMLWQPLATVAMYGVNLLLQLSGLTTAAIPPNTLLLDKFGITVAESCSGVESIALFTGLYVIVGLLDWPHLRRRRYFAVFPAALLLLILFNLVRVYALIIAGYYINPEIAFMLFHTYAGLVSFIIYSAIFWTVSYRHLVYPRKKEHRHDAA